MEHKLFLIRCPRCNWKRSSTGLKSDLQDLFEIKTCSKCGKPRTFRCPNCGQIAKMLRIKGNKEANDGNNNS